MILLHFTGLLGHRAESMTEKRGFGLVGDYGSDLSSSDEEGETVNKKVKKQEENEVDQIEERKEKELKRLSERESDRLSVQIQLSYELNKQQCHFVEGGLE